MSNKAKIDSKFIREAGGAEAALAYYSNSKEFRDCFKNILQQELDSVIINSEAEELTGNVNTLYHLLGQRNALRNIIKLLHDVQ